MRLNTRHLPSIEGANPSILIWGLFPSHTSRNLKLFLIQDTNYHFSKWVNNHCWLFSGTRFTSGLCVGGMKCAVTWGALPPLSHSCLSPCVHPEQDLSGWIALFIPLSTAVHAVDPTGAGRWVSPLLGEVSLCGQKTQTLMMGRKHDLERQQGFLPFHLLCFHFQQGGGSWKLLWAGFLYFRDRGRRCWVTAGSQGRGTCSVSLQNMHNCPKVRKILQFNVYCWAVPFHQVTLSPSNI